MAIVGLLPEEVVVLANLRGMMIVTAIVLVALASWACGSRVGKPVPTGPSKAKQPAHVTWVTPPASVVVVDPEPEPELASTPEPQVAVHAEAVTEHPHPFEVATVTSTDPEPDHEFTAEHDHEGDQLLGTDGPADDEADEWGQSLADIKSVGGIAPQPKWMKRGIRRDRADAGR